MLKYSEDRIYITYKENWYACIRMYSFFGIKLHSL